MEFSAIYHNVESNYSYPISKNTLKIILKVKRDDHIKHIYVLYESKYLIMSKQKEVEMKDKISTRYNDYYYIYLKVEDVRIGYVFKIIDTNNKVYYYSENKLISEDNYDFKKCHYDYFQYPYINEIDILKINKKFSKRVFYQIFVDRFYDGLKNENIVINDKINVKWGENDKIDRFTFAGGNLKGITKKLDYLKDLGINALYLTPIFESYSNHKYETYDYKKIAKDFGDETSLKELISEAHKRDILLVLDGVFNHIAFYSPIFLDVVKEGKKSKYYKWFIIHDENGKVDLDNVNFESFGFGKFMPKLNLNNKETQDYVIDICKHYLNEFNIDGYRMDVADEIPHNFFKRLRSELKLIKDDIFLISENWHDGHASLDDNSEFDSIMNYPFVASIIDFLGYNEIDEEEFVNRINLLLIRYKDQTLHSVLNLLDSHDKARFINEVNFNEDKALIGYSLLFIYSGIPMIYYGSEVGLDGYNDPDCRKMFIWDENKWNKKRLLFIKSLIEIHKALDLNNEDYSFKIEYLKDKHILKCSINNKFNTDNIILEEYINTSLKEGININELFDNNKKTVLLSNNYKDNRLNMNGFIIVK